MGKSPSGHLLLYTVEVCKPIYIVFFKVLLTAEEEKVSNSIQNISIHIHLFEKYVLNKKYNADDCIFFV